MDLAAELATHRDFLVALAYRMLGSLQSAEDVVQEAFVRAERLESGSGADSGAAAEAGDEIREPRAWLTRIVTRLALDELKSARAQRESYVGPWLPEPLVAGAPPGPTTPAVGAAVDPADRVTLDEQISLALLTVLETLSPAERAVYVLHEAFGVPLSEVAGIVGRSPAATRQLASRARRHVQDRAPRFDPEPREHARVVRAFQSAVTGGDLDALARLLDEDVELRADGGGVVRAALRPVVGRSAVVRALAAGLRTAPELVLRPITVNGAPGLLARFGHQALVVAFVVHEGRISHLHLVANPEKLTRLSDAL